MDFKPTGDAWDSFVRSEPNIRSSREEKLAAAAIADYLEIETTWTGAGHGRDVQIKYPNGIVEVEVTQDLDDKHKEVTAKIVSESGYELIKDERITQSLLVFTTRDTRMNTLDAQGHKLVQAMKAAELKEIHESELWRLDTEYFKSQLSDAVRTSLELFKKLKLQSARLLDSSGELIRLQPMVGGMFGGTSVEFDDWLGRFVSGGLFEKKRDRIATQNPDYFHPIYESAGCRFKSYAVY
jgi:hypothetical protein